MSDYPRKLYEASEILIHYFGVAGVRITSDQRGEIERAVEIIYDAAREDLDRIRQKAVNDVIGEALNSGDGTYRP